MLYLLFDFQTVEQFENQTINTTLSEQFENQTINTTLSEQFENQTINTTLSEQFENVIEIALKEAKTIPCKSFMDW
jgi:hypothetical protein